MFWYDDVLSSENSSIFTVFTWKQPRCYLVSVVKIVICNLATTNIWQWGGRNGHLRQRWMMRGWMWPCFFLSNSNCHLCFKHNCTGTFHFHPFTRLQYGNVFILIHFGPSLQKLQFPETFSVFCVNRRWKCYQRVTVSSKMFSCKWSSWVCTGLHTATISGIETVDGYRVT